MLRIRKRIRKSIWISLLLLGVGSSFCISYFDIHLTKDLEATLQKKHGSDYPNILNYTNFKIKDLNILHLDKYIPKQPDMSWFTGYNKNDLDKVSEVINKMNDFYYIEYQSNPNLLEKHGGNCQALALRFKDYCKMLDISCNIGYTKDHMYNIIDINNTQYKVDLVNKTMEEV